MLRTVFLAYVALLHWQPIPHQYIIDFLGKSIQNSKYAHISFNYMNWAHMAHKILTSRGGFMVHISSSSIGIITPRHDQHQLWIELKQWIKAHGPYYLSYTHGKRLLQQELIFTQNDNKTRGTSSHLWLMIQAHKSPWGNFGSCGLEGQEVCSVKLQRFKVDKRNMLFGMSSPTP